MEKTIIMPRKARNKSNTNYYHVMVQGLNKECIFKDEYHIKKYKKILLNKLKESNITILAYCIMNNHVHLLIHSKKIEYLSKFMQKVNMTYSHFYNKQNNRIGYVFRDRFRSQDILNQKHLYTCLHYIHNNPVKANIVKKMSDYKYSSYNEFLGKKIIISAESIKLLFGKKSNYIDEFKSLHYANTYEDFIDVDDSYIDEFISKFEITNDIKICNLKTHIKLRRLFIREAQKTTNIKTTDIAKLLNMPVSTVAYTIKKMS